MSRQNLFFSTTSVAVGLLAAFFLYLEVWPNTEHQGIFVSEADSIQITPKPSDEDHVLWEGSDSVVVVEYFDLDCPYCRSLLLEEDKLPESVKDRVRLIYRWFPLIDIYPRSL